MKRLILAAATALVTTPAFAHLDPEAHGSFAAGLSHPVFGADHILAMVAVGLWAAVLGGRAVWALPSAFVAAMVAGFIASVGGVPLPFVEPMILVSVFVLGLAVALTLRLPVAAAAGIVGAFGLFHGHAHGGELGTAAALAFGAGFAASALPIAPNRCSALVAAGLLTGSTPAAQAEQALQKLRMPTKPKTATVKPIGPIKAV